MGRQTIESLIGANLWAMYPALAGSATEHAFRKAMTEHVQINLEDYYAPFDLWFEIHIYPSPDGLSAFIRDISERKKAENALRESSENLERAEEQAKLGSWSVDLATQKRQWSKQMFGIFGLGPAGGVPEFEDVLPRYHPEDRQRIREWFAKALRGETPEPGVLRTNPELLPLRYLQPIFPEFLDFLRFQEILGNR